MNSKLLKDYLRRLGNIREEYRHYTVEEIGYFEDRLIVINLSRMRLLTIMAVFVQEICMIQTIRGGLNYAENRWDLLGQILMILTLSIHELIYYAWIKKA